jgi:hypothetical protein
VSSRFDSWLRNGSRALRDSREWLSDTPISVALEIMRKRSVKYAIPTRADVTMREISETKAIPETGEGLALATQAAFLGRWAMSGYPTITLTHKTAAALMATTVSPEIANEMVHAPWPAFVVRLPTPLLYCGPDEPGTLIGAMQSGEGWAYWMECESERTAPMLGLAMSARDIACEGDVMIVQTKDDENQNGPVSDFVARNERLYRTLILGLCLQLSDPQLRASCDRGTATRKPPRVKGRPQDTLPTYRSFDLRLAVKVDVLEAVRGYIHHGGGHPKVQSLVRGFFRKQPHGVKSSLRKTIWIEPYWRGPVDAPVSARVCEP